MKKILINWFVFVSAVLFTACNKDTKPLSYIQGTNDLYEASFVCEDTALDWMPKDVDANLAQLIQSYGSKNVTAAQYDNFDRNIIYYLSWDLNDTPYNLWKFNRKTNRRTLLDKGLIGEIDVSTRGWLVYSKFDKNVYIMKTNGDSLKQITQQGTYMEPRWSEEGTNLYFYDDFVGIIIKTNYYGKITDTIKQVGNAGAATAINNFIYYFKLNGSDQRINRLNTITGEDKTVIILNDYKYLGYINWYTNPSNSVLYWWAYTSGLYKTDLNTNVTTKIANSGYGSSSLILKFKQSRFNKRFLAIESNDSVIDKYHIKTSSIIVEYTEDGSCRRKVYVPD